MRICDNVHQIRIDFDVTPSVRRFVYVYLITGRYCYLIDAGVKGSEETIAAYLRGIGRELSDIRGLFLTHAHPDHIGAARRLKEMTHCAVYAGPEEKAWIEDVDRQFAERPIPNFYNLVGGSVSVDRVVDDGESMALESGVTLRALKTAGHSFGSLSYLWEETGVAFIGDAVPVAGDIPIYVDPVLSLRALDSLTALDAACFCPAWDKVYMNNEFSHKIADARELIERIGGCVSAILQKDENAADGELVRETCRRLGAPHFADNPLFKTTVLSHRN